MTQLWVLVEEMSSLGLETNSEEGRCKGTHPPSHLEVLCELIMAEPWRLGQSRAGWWLWVITPDRRWPRGQ